MEAVELLCNVCYGEFSEENVNKRPQMLHCGHTFCTDCIRQFLQDRKECGKCRKNITYRSYTDVPINFDLMSLTNKNPTPAIPEPEEDPMQCSDHKTQKIFMCIPCNDLICGSCIYFNHIECKVLQIEDALNELREVKDVEIRIQIEGLKKNNEERSSYLTDLNEYLNVIKVPVVKMEQTIEDETMSKIKGESLLENLEVLQAKLASATEILDFLHSESSWKSMVEDFDFCKFGQIPKMISWTGSQVLLQDVPQSELLDYINENVEYCRINPTSFIKEVKSKHGRLQIEVAQLNETKYICCVTLIRK